MISPTTVGEIQRKLGLPRNRKNLQLLTEWWIEIERWEREQCAQIAEAIDSERGNEKEIARAIRERTE